MSQRGVPRRWSGRGRAWFDQKKLAEGEQQQDLPQQQSSPERRTSQQSQTSPERQSSRQSQTSPERQTSQQSQTSPELQSLEQQLQQLHISQRQLLPEPKPGPSSISSKTGAHTSVGSGDSSEQEKHPETSGTVMHHSYGIPGTSRTYGMETGGDVARAGAAAVAGAGDGDGVRGRGARFGRMGRAIGRGGDDRAELQVGAAHQPPQQEQCFSKKGTTGDSVLLCTNYYRVETVPNWVLYQYQVEFSIEEDRESEKKNLLRQHVDRLGRSYIFDGRLLYSARRLTEGNQPLLLTSIRAFDNLPVHIEIRLIQSVQPGNSIYLQVFNILVRRCLAHLNLQLVNRNYFDVTAPIRLPEFHMEIWPGYVTSIRQNDCGILMCAEIAFKVMRQDTAWDLMKECQKPNQDFRELFKQSILGRIVLTDYNNKTYRIDDVDFTQTPESKFRLRDNEEITYVEYYLRRYHIRIRDLSQPLLATRCRAVGNQPDKVNICLLVPELCRLTGVDGSMWDDGTLRKALIQHTKVDPEERIRRLEDFNRRLTDSPEIMGELRNWEMRLGRTLVTVPGRELPEEILIGGGGQKYTAGSDWIREVRTRPLLLAANGKKWAVVCPLFLIREVTSFLDSLHHVATTMNFYLDQPALFRIQSDRPAEYADAVDELLAGTKLDLIMFICVSDRPERYSAIKRKCYVDRGIQSQVVLSRSLKTKGLSVATRVALQLNCKLGGVPWATDNPMQNVMVIGYDVYHDTERKDRSYGAVVASLNNTISSWYSTVSHHSNGEELSTALSIDMQKALRAYMQRNGTLPSRIFFYRDGIGEGQIPFVIDQEVDRLKSVLEELYGGNTWKMAFIIVSKRINTRIFKDGKNPRSGTIVDDMITLPEKYDFFLVSQSVNKGTVTPTNYNVISDNSGLRPDQIQRWTYKMTHLYYNWTGAVRVPAPCQYAHKLALLVGKSLRAAPREALNTTLFFL